MCLLTPVVSDGAAGFSEFGEKRLVCFCGPDSVRINFTICLGLDADYFAMQAIIDLIYKMTYRSHTYIVPLGVLA